jgi:membrane-associated phospholipid phosphatase
MGCLLIASFRISDYRLLLQRSYYINSKKVKAISMKQIIFSIAVLFAAAIAAAQPPSVRPGTSYEAAGWKTWLLSNPGKISVAAPPGATPAKQELQTMRQQLSQLNAQQTAAIQYWDAGAPAYRWNQVIDGLLEENFSVMLRMPAAWMNIAIYDATILAWKEKVKYKRKRPGEMDPLVKPLVKAPQTYSYPCEHTVTAAAAAHMLAYFFPARADSIMQLARAASQSRIDAGVQYPSDAAAGWKLGEQVAKEIIEKAKNDGSTRQWDGTMNKDPKKWTGAYPMGYTMASFMPIVLQTAAQFRPQAPPDFETEMKELKNFKQNAHSRFLAHYWANTSDAWTKIASQKMFEYRMADDAPAVARIYTVLTTAYHDMGIAIMDAKYTYWGIRPNQYDTSYKPLITTPPFPGYPSGHAAGAGMSAAVLEYFFPADAALFRQMAQDCADSRFYAGIHFRVDNETGLRMGAALGKYVVETWMKQ